MLVFGGFLLLGGRAADRSVAGACSSPGWPSSRFASLAVAVAPGPAALVAAPRAAGPRRRARRAGRDSASSRPRPRGARASEGAGGLRRRLGLGAAVGLLLGGVLTDALSWPWVFLINVPIGIVAIAAALRYVPESRAAGVHRGFDCPAPSWSRAGSCW
jgi:MFS family permease